MADNLRDHDGSHFLPVTHSSKIYSHDEGMAIEYSRGRAALSMLLSFKGVTHVPRSRSGWLLISSQIASRNRKGLCVHAWHCHYRGRAVGGKNTNKSAIKSTSICPWRTPFPCCISHLATRLLHSPDKLSWVSVADSTVQLGQALPIQGGRCRTALCIPCPFIRLVCTLIDKYAIHKSRISI